MCKNKSHENKTKLEWPNYLEKCILAKNKREWLKSTPTSSPSPASDSVK